MATAEAENEEDNLVVLAEVVAAQTATLWDPHLSQDWDQEKPTEQCILRIKRYSRQNRTLNKFPSVLPTYVRIVP